MDGVNLSGTNINATSTEQVIAIGLSAYRGPLDVLIWLDAAMDYAAFKAAVTAGGLEADGETLTTPFTVEYPVTIPLYNYIEGTDGDDTIEGTADADYFHNLGGGSDTVNGYDGDDFFESGGGRDTFNGGEGSDTVSYANETSSVYLVLGGSFNYTTISSYGANRFENRDNLNSIENAIGTEFDDSIDGSLGDNQLEGGGGIDRLTGAGGDDILYGGEGNDTLLGSEGNDIYIGGADKDIFEILINDGDVEIIRDFNLSEGDQIDILTSDSVSNLTQLYANSYVRHLSTTIEDYTNNGAMDTVMRFDRGSGGVDDSDYLLILEGFSAPIVFEYFIITPD